VGAFRHASERLIKTLRTSAPRLWVFAGLVCLGCQNSYRCETVVGANGKVERAIYQPDDQTPDAVKDPKKWMQIKRAPTPSELDKVGWPSSIKEIYSTPSRIGQSYFAAWGTFASPKGIPDHLVFLDKKFSNDPQSRLVRDWIVTDYVFATEYHWRETLTDVVTWDGMHRAQKELIDLAIGLWHDAFVESVGTDYDDTEFVRWLDAEGRTWVSEMLDFAFIHCSANKGFAARAALGKELTAICTRHGLKFPASSNTDVMYQRAIGDFLIEQMGRRVRNKKDGQLVNRKTVLGWITETKTSQATEQVPRRQLSLLDRSLKKVVQRRFGDESAFDRRLGSLMIRMIGWHWPASVLEERLFDYTLTLPGEVAQTNGQILSTNQVRWTFDSKDAFPLGYSMEVRSIAPQLSIQRELLPSRPPLSRQTLLDLISSMSGYGDLVAAMKECHNQGTMRPLYVYCDRIAKSTERARELEAANRVITVLKLPKRSPNG
jgi:hypothetical protein